MATEGALKDIKEAVLLAFKAAHWTRTDGTAIASRTFQTLTVTKDAVAYLSKDDGFNRTLSFSYDSEGRNVAAGDSVLIPHLCLPHEAFLLAAAAIYRAEQSINQSYGVRLSGRATTPKTIE